MKIRKKSQSLQELIGNLSRHGSEKKAGTWKAVARSLNKPRRKRYEVSLFSIEKNSKPRETIVVPGIVLGSGDIKKSVTVAALRFTKDAREKIEKAGGKCLEIQELLEKDPKGHKIRIMA